MDIRSMPSLWRTPSCLSRYSVRLANYWSLHIFVSSKMELGLQDPSNSCHYSNSYGERQKGLGGTSKTHGHIVEAKHHTWVAKGEGKSAESHYTDVAQG